MNGDYYKVRNRETLRKLESGIEITRAVKHEPIDFAALTASELEEATNDRNGSKFLASWPLQRVVDWTTEQVAANGWRFPPGARMHVRARLAQPVGYVFGQLVHTITVRISGRWVHAYPDED